MKMNILIPTAIALLTTIQSPGLAKCPEVTGSVNKEAHAGIAKDGTHTPMEGHAGQVKTESSVGTTTTSKEALPETAKDGNDMPMGESSSLATSEQDVAAQQKGGKTAAATAAQEACD